MFVNLSCRDGCLYVSIEDDGKGFDYQMLRKQHLEDTNAPLGIPIMSERVSLVGGVSRGKQTRSGHLHLRRNSFERGDNEH